MIAPHISPELLDWLDYLFPDQVPEGDAAASLYRAQGEQRVVRKVRAEFKQQNKNVLETD